MSSGRERKTKVQVLEGYFCRWGLTDAATAAFLCRLFPLCSSHARGADGDGGPYHDYYGDHIAMIHVTSVENNPTGRKKSLKAIDI
jgi:hypothetical protein